MNTNIKMAKRNPKHNVFLLSWDMTGLETVLDLSTIEKLHEEEEKERIVKILSDPNAQDPGGSVNKMMNQMVQHIIMRARANSQRHYEVYTIQTTAGITEKDLWTMFNDNPQNAADLIRERGNKIYSDRVNQRTQVIV